MQRMATGTESCSAQETTNLFNRLIYGLDYKEWEKGSGKERLFE